MIFIPDEVAQISVKAKKNANMWSTQRDYFVFTRRIQEVVRLLSVSVVKLNTRMWMR